MRGVLDGLVTKYFFHHMWVHMCGFMFVYRPCYRQIDTIDLSRHFRVVFCLGMEKP